MKKLVLFLVLTFLFANPVSADTRYISGVLKITLRSGPGNDHRVLTMIETGQEVEILDADNPDWTRIRTSNGKEGWVLKRFLTERKPDAMALEQTNQQSESLAKRVDELLREKARLKSDHDKLASELAETRNMLTSLSESYQNLKKESADSLELQAKYKQSISDLAEQTKHVDNLAQELGRVRFYQKIRWFLSGAGVLLVGFLLGVSVRKNRRRSSLL